MLQPAGPNRVSELLPVDKAVLVAFKGETWTARLFDPRKGQITVVPSAAAPSSEREQAHVTWHPGQCGDAAEP